MKNYKIGIAAVLLSLSTVKAQKDSTETIRPFQLTFVTPMGTNGIQAPKITNRVSLNVLAGVSRGLKGFEAGTLANILLKDAEGVQVVGFSNVVLGKVTGAQFAGYANYSGGDHTGVAGAGFCNVNLGALRGAQIAGMVNYNRKGVTGAQIAAYANVTTGDLHGTQVAGFANVATGTMEGTQVSGFANYAKKVKGVQVGIVNIADSVEGVSIGFLNIVRKGLHQFEVSADEMFYANAAFRTGTRSFYNILSAGMAPSGSKSLWHIGYGVGTSVKLKEKWYTELTMSAHHVNKGSFYFGTSELFRLYWGVEHQLTSKIGISAGPTFNLYVSDTYDSDFRGTFDKLPPYSLVNETNTYGFNYKAWVGLRAAIRFF